MSSRRGGRCVPSINPILFSATALLTSSGSLKLAVNGNRSLSKLKLDIETERPLCRVEGAVPSSSSRALKESSESLEDLERSGTSNSCSGRDRESACWPLGDKLIEKAIFKTYWNQLSG